MNLSIQYQWELDQTVPVGGAGMVAFACEGDDAAVVVEPREVEGGAYVADVPNHLLEDGRDLSWWREVDGSVVECGSVRVSRRPKPDGYVSQQTDALTYAKVTQEMRDAVASAVADEPAPEAEEPAPAADVRGE